MNSTDFRKSQRSFIQSSYVDGLKILGNKKAKTHRNKLKNFQLRLPDLSRKENDATEGSSSSLAYSQHHYDCGLEKPWEGINLDRLWETHIQEEMLGDLLRPLVGASNSRRQARRLIHRFGSLPQTLAADPNLLSEIEGVGNRTAEHMALTFKIAQLMAKENLVTEKPILSSWSALLGYLRTAMAFDEREHVRILFFDKRHRLVHDEIVSSGTLDHTPLYPREIVRRALDLSASGILVVHNHPSGDPHPSMRDVTTTKQLEQACQTLEIVLHDHVIVGRDGHISLRGLKLI